MRLKDQMGRNVVLDEPAKRIVSLVPSQTELLHYFGLEEETVGITKFCVHPKEWFESRPRVGGTKKVDISKVAALSPDLIIANKEENTPGDIDQLMAICSVYVSDVNNPDDALAMIKDVGLLCGVEQRAVDLIDDIQGELAAFPTYSGSVLYFIWREPYMVCGTHNYIHSIISKLGFENLIEAPRYVELTADQIRAMDPDYIFLSTEPYPFEQKHFSEFRDLVDCEIKLVDGEMFSWYGSRMLKMRSYFQQLFD